MRRPSDDKPEPEGGGAAERLREFRAQRRPPGVSPDQVKADITGSQPPNENQADKKQDE